MTSNQSTVKALDRYLSPIDVWGMAFGCMVGWGVFAMPGNTFLPVAGPAGTTIALILGTIVILIVAGNLTYLMGRTAITGGIYSYTKQAFGRDHAFLSTWFLCLSYLTIVFLNGTALFYIVRMVFGKGLWSSLHYTLGGNKIYIGETLISVAVLIGVGVLFVVAKPVLQRIQTFLALVLMAGVVITAAFCLPHAFASGNLGDFGFKGFNRGYAVFSLMILAPWAYVGFEVTSFDTAHFRFPIRKSGKILFIAIIAAAIAYISMGLISVASVPDGFGSWQEYIVGRDTLEGPSSVPTFFAAESIMGKTGLVIMLLTAIAAILTGIIGGYRATTRVLSTMAEDRILSEAFSKTTYSILFIMGISVVIVFMGQNALTWYVDVTSFGAIVGFGYTSAAAWKIAAMENNRWVKITGMAGLLISVVFVIVQIVPRLTVMEVMGPQAFLMLAFWCLLGFVFYWRTVVNSTLTEHSGMSTSGIALFSLTVYSSFMWLAKLIMSEETVESIRRDVVWGGLLILIIIFIGLAVMIYVQDLVRQKHEASEREKIRAVEGSLAKSRFLFNMSHDIRTPMNAIIGYTKLAMDEGDTEKMHDHLKKIDLSSRHLLEIINDILEMSRIESGKLEIEFIPTDLNDMFEGMRDIFTEQMKEKDIDFSVHTSGIRHNLVWCDKRNLNRVLLNVISNAYKFTPEGGTVNVSLWEIGRDETEYATYEIRIQDTGIGMSKEFAEKMFDAFERERSSTDSGIEGTGLGLAITKSIIDLMGGTIEVMTAPGAGTEIIVRLKLKQASPEDMAGTQATPEETQPEEVDFSGKRLLVVEDNMVNLEIARMILEQMGFVVETAENGKIAVDMVEDSEHGYYDAVLMDIQMPVMDGYTATKCIRALEDPILATIPIVAMTANAFAEDVRSSEEAGMQAHIAKPIDVNIMRNTLAEVLGRRKEPC